MIAPSLRNICVCKGLNGEGIKGVGVQTFTYTDTAQGRGNQYSFILFLFKADCLEGQSWCVFYFLFKADGLEG